MAATLVQWFIAPRDASEHFVGFIDDNQFERGSSAERAADQAGVLEPCRLSGLCPLKRDDDITNHPPLRLGSPRGHQIALVEESMQWWFKRAADALLPHHELIEHIGTRLLDEGLPSGRSLAAMCRESKRER